MVVIFILWNLLINTDSFIFLRFETSAKDDIGIGQGVMSLISEIMKLGIQQQKRDESVIQIRAKPKPTEPQQNGCPC